MDKIRIRDVRLIKFKSKGYKETEFLSLLFPLLSIVILILATAFLSLIIITIAVLGIPHLIDSLTSAEVLFSLRLSLVTASISTLICILIAVPSAYALTRTAVPFRKLTNIMIELPHSLPYIVLGLSLLLIFSSDLGKYLRDYGFKVIFDMKGIVFAHITVNLPFMLRLIKTAFNDIDIRMEYIAGTLGASKWQRFSTITLPMSRNTIINAAVLAWSRALGEFGATLMLVGLTRMKTETLPGSIYLSISTGENEPAMATSVILLTVSCCSLIVTSLLNRKTHSRNMVS